MYLRMARYVKLYRTSVHSFSFLVPFTILERLHYSIKRTVEILVVKKLKSIFFLPKYEIQEQNKCRSMRHSIFSLCILILH